LPVRALLPSRIVERGDEREAKNKGREFRFHVRFTEQASGFGIEFLF
jgi:hypothetical protein